VLASLLDQGSPQAEHEPVQSGQAWAFDGLCSHGALENRLRGTLPLPRFSVLCLGHCS